MWNGSHERARRRPKNHGIYWPNRCHACGMCLDTVGTVLMCRNVLNMPVCEEVIAWSEVICSERRINYYSPWEDETKRRRRTLNAVVFSGNCRPKCNTETQVSSTSPTFTPR